MFERQRSGSAVCPSCGKLVGVNDSSCWNCGRTHPGMWGFGRSLRRLGHDLGTTQVIVWGCVALYVASLLVDLSGIRFSDPLGFLAPSGRALRVLGASGAYPVLHQGAWWTLLTAGWLHGGLLHIFFNLMWVRQLAPATAAQYGPGRMFLIYLISSMCGFLASAVGSVYLYFVPLMGGHPYGISVGASAAVFGLLGAMIAAGQRGVGSQLGRQAWGFAVVLFIFGLLFVGIDNWAHLGGFVGGYAVGRWMNALRPERPDHLLAALALLALTVGAFLLSLVRAWGSI